MSAVVQEQPATVLRSESIDASPPPGVDQEKARLSLSHALITLALLLVWTVAHLVWLSHLEQGHAQSSLYPKLRSQLAEGTAPVSGAVRAGDPVAVLDVPALGVTDLVVVEGTRPAQLQTGPGHLSGSVLPGQTGVSVVAGKSLTFGAPFADIGSLAPGTVITVTTGQGVFGYAVKGVRTEGDPLPAALAPGASRLTLVTAARGSGVLGALTAGSSVYVDAELRGKAAASGPVGVVDAEPRLMEIGFDTPTLAMLALALQLVVLCLAGSFWAWQRWSRTAAWMVGTPCVLASLWLASTLGTRLLPGLV